MAVSAHRATASTADCPHMAIPATVPPPPPFLSWPRAKSALGELRGERSGLAAPTKIGGGRAARRAAGARPIAALTKIGSGRAARRAAGARPIAAPTKICSGRAAGARPIAGSTKISSERAARRAAGARPTAAPTKIGIGRAARRAAGARPDKTRSEEQPDIQTRGIHRHQHIFAL
jgi:hypothetical protein